MISMQLNAQRQNPNGSGSQRCKVHQHRRCRLRPSPAVLILLSGMQTPLAGARPIRWKTDFDKFVIVSNFERRHWSRQSQVGLRELLLLSSTSWTINTLSCSQMTTDGIYIGQALQLSNRSFLLTAT